MFCTNFMVQSVLIVFFFVTLLPYFVIVFNHWHTKSSSERFNFKSIVGECVIPVIFIDKIRFALCASLLPPFPNSSCHGTCMQRSLLFSSISLCFFCSSIASISVYLFEITFWNVSGAIEISSLFSVCFVNMSSTSASAFVSRSFYFKGFSFLPWHKRVFVIKI